MERIITLILTMTMQITLWLLSATLQITIKILEIGLPFLFKAIVAGGKAIFNLLRQPRRVRDTHVLRPGDRSPENFN